MSQWFSDGRLFTTHRHQFVSCFVAGDTNQEQLGRRVVGNVSFGKAGKCLRAVAVPGGGR